MNFIIGFITKHLTTLALEKILIILLGVLVKRTESKIDDEIFDSVFNKIDT